MKTINVLLVVAIGIALPQVYGHGYLTSPPSRSSMWRFGYPVPPNYSDNELYCGERLQDESISECGICGDPIDKPRPRPNENGGTYGLGIITETYRAGSTISVTVKLSANHLGYFQFDVCNMDNGPEEDSCFVPMALPDGSYRYPIPNVGGGRDFTTNLVLPPGMTCEHCVLRWSYRAGNTWGICEDGHGEVGCGKQETFRNCADIAIQN